jgi:hypothetical protein
VVAVGGVVVRGVGVENARVRRAPWWRWAVGVIGGRGRGRAYYPVVVVSSSRRRRRRTNVASRV